MRSTEDIANTINTLAILLYYLKMIRLLNYVEEHEILRILIRLIKSKI